MAKKKKRKAKDVDETSIPVEEGADAKRVEPDEWYKAEFTEAKIGEGKWGPYVVLNFKLKNGYFEDTEESAKGWNVTRLMTAKVTEGGDFWGFVKIFMGKEPKIGKSIDLTAFYGNKYSILVQDQKKKKDDKIQRQQVTKIKRIKKKKK